MNFNFKKIAFWLTIITLVSFSLSWFLFSTAGVSWADFFRLTDVKMNNSMYKYEINEEKNIPLDGIHGIEVNTISTDINFIAENREDIKVSFKGFTSTSDRNRLPRLTVGKLGNKIAVNIEYPKGIQIGFNISDLNLDIYVPEDYSKDLYIHTTSGNVKSDILILNSFEFQSISGNLKGNKILSRESNFKTTSGNVKIDTFDGNLYFKSVSGNLTAKYVEPLDDDIIITTTSGDIDLKLGDNADFILNTETVSGEINCEFPMVLEGEIDNKILKGRTGNGENKIDISTISGKINIVK